MSLLETRFETIAGRRVRLARLGAGDPVILLHGYPDNLQIWSRLAPLLARNQDVIAIDWPGMGESEAWPGGASPFDMAGRILELLDSWKIERATLVGMDMGGQPALVFAAKHPERIRKLVVMNSLVLWNEATSWEIRLLRRFGFNRFALRWMPRAVFRRAERTFVPPGTRLPPDLRDALWQSFARAEVRSYIIRMCAGFQGTLPLLPALYPKIGCPTLVLWAERDKHFPVAHARGLHGLIPGSRLSIVDGAEHWMVWDRAEDLASRIQEFLAT